MFRRLKKPARLGLWGLMTVWLFVILPFYAHSAPYAAMVIDARNGKVLHSENADTRLHPASLTKMMTLYVAFEAIENGEISLDTMVKISSKAASEQPSKLGLRAGQRIKLRYLIRAACVKSANDAATAIAEAISGSEAAFARRMNRTAKAMGMTRTTFKNAHGLTQHGHLSTARDMTTLGRHVFYDYPQYYNLFSRETTDAGVRKVRHTNSRFLNSYRGADGIKTGYTRAAGYNLVASAERGGERIITTVFGGRSTITRNKQVAKLMDLGFRKASTRVAITKPKRPNYNPNASNSGTRIIRVTGAVKKSPFPKMRPGSVEPILANVDLSKDIDNALEQLQTVSLTSTQKEQSKIASKPKPRPNKAIENEPPLDTTTQALALEVQNRLISRVSTSGSREWGVHVGKFPTRYAAEKMLIKTALAEMETLGESLRKVVQTKQGFDANFYGISHSAAQQACQKLETRLVECIIIDPAG